MIPIAAKPGIVSKDASNIVSYIAGKVAGKVVSRTVSKVSNMRDAFLGVLSKIVSSGTFSARKFSKASRLSFGPSSWHKRGVLAVVLSTLILGGCTTKLVVGPLYNRLDDQMRGEFHKLAKFNDSQIAHFEQRVGHFHVWHRQVELPRYAALLGTIESSIRVRDDTTREDINNWINTAEGFTRSVRECHPVNFSYDSIQTLEDNQVNFIERRFARERRKNFARYNSRTAEERKQRRYNNIIKWAGRANFDFTNKQKRLLNETLEKQISLRKQYYKAVDAWNRKLFQIARKQNAPDYEQKMANQVTQLWSLLENAHPEEWQANRALWRDFGIKFVSSMTSDQRLKAGAWLRKMRKTLVGISKDQPSFKPTYNPAHGCTITRNG